MSYKDEGEARGWTYTEDGNPSSSGIYECSVIVHPCYAPDNGIACIKQCQYDVKKGWLHLKHKTVYAWRTLEAAPTNKPETGGRIPWTRQP